MIIVVTLTDLQGLDMKTTFSTWGELVQWLERSIRPEDYTRIAIAFKRI